MYAGTKEGAKDLVNDAAKIDKSIKKNDLSYANLVKAIHVVQDQMGITGTTQKEAEKTITGSLNMVKSAWANLMPALIEGGDSFDQCIENLIYSAEKFGDNIMPAIEKALGGVGTLIERLAPKIEEHFPVLVDKLLPPLLQAATSLLKALIKALPGIIGTVIKELPDILKQVGEAIAEALGVKNSTIKKISTGFEKIGKSIAKFIPVLLGLFAAYKIFKKVKGIASLFGGKASGKSGGIFNYLTNIGKEVKGKDLLKGILKIGAVVGALAGAVYLLGLLAKEMRKQDIKASEILELVGVIGAVGVVGGAVGKIAQILGTGGVAAIKTAGAGIVVIAEVIGGIGLIVAAFGALAQIDGFNDFMTAGGEALANLFRIIGDCIGSLIAGIGEGLTSTLPSIGANLAGFSKSLEGGNWNVLYEFFSAFAGLKDVPLSGGLFGLFTGSAYNGMEKMAEILPSLGRGIKSFFASIGSRTDFTPLASVLKAIAFVEDVPEDGGLAQLFTGSSQAGLEGMVKILPGLGTAASSFMTNIGGAKDFTPLSSLLNALSSVEGMPNSGGLFQLFGGEQTDALAKMTVILPGLGTAAASFMSNVAGITDFTPISNLIGALSSVSQMPFEGGLAQLFAGSHTKGLKAMMGILPGLGASAVAFFANLGDIRDFSPIPNLISALSSVSQMPFEGGLAQLFAGSHTKGLKAMMGILPGLATSVVTFFTNLGGITDFSAIPNLIGALSSVSQMPFEGGLAQLFAGSHTKGLKAMVVILPELATSVATFFANLGGITDFSVIPALFSALAKVSELECAEGIKQLFTGDPYKALGQMSDLLPGLGSSVKTFFDSISGIDNFDKMSELFTVLGGLGEKIGTEGGLWDAIGEFFGGSEESAITQLGTSLKTFGENTKDFFAQVNALNIDNLNALFDSLNKLKTISTDLEDVVTANFTEIVRVIKEKCTEPTQAIATMLTLIKATISMTNLAPSGKTMMDTLISGINSKKTAVISAISSITKEINKKINSTITGGNWALKQFGSTVRLEAFGYAGGTGGHRGGNAIVNDGRGAELVQMPNGRTFIPSGRNVFLPNAPRGMKVLDALNTAKLFGKSSPTFRYANGTGDLDVFAYEKGSSLADAIVKKFVNFSNSSGYALNAGKAAVSTVKTAMGGWGDKLIKELGLGNYVASAGVNQRRSTVFRAYAKPGYDKNSYDQLSNALASVRYTALRYGSLANAYKGRGYANGTGTVELPQYSPSSTYASASRVENNTYAPQFSITINGAEDTRSMERKVKQFVREALEETFSSMARKSPRLQEV